MIAQRSGAYKSFIILTVLTIASAASADDVAPPGALGRAGPAFIDRAGIEEALVEARILERWRSGREPPIAALRSADLRRRVVIKALETRVVRQEAARRGLQPGPDALNRALVNALKGRPYDAAAGPAPADLDGRLAARYEAPVERIRRVAADLLEASAMASALVDAVPDAEHRARWLQSETRITLDLLLIPRVPTGSEIEAVVGLQPDDIDIWYDLHRERYARPEKARVRRALARPAGDSPADWLAAKTRATRWKRRLATEDVDEVMAAADGDEARRGGNFGRVTRDRLPQAFAAGEGGVTAPIREADGWAIYLVEGITPALNRPKHDKPLRREIAATLMRETDVLPHARHTAERARLFLRMRRDTPAFKAFLKRERIRRKSTRPFARSERTLVPGIGLAPALVEAAFALRGVGAISPVVRVRQDYIVARLVERTEPDPARWPAVQVEYVERWKTKARRTAVEDWLSETLRGQPLWIDMPRIAAIDIPGAGTAVDKRGRSLSAP